MDRVKFVSGGQRKFLDLVIERMNSPSLRGLLQFGFDVNYSTLKNYYVEARFLPKNLFEDFCEVAEIPKGELDSEVIRGNWGQKLGGSIGKRRKI